MYCLNADRPQNCVSHSALFCGHTEAHVYLQEVALYRLKQTAAPAKHAFCEDTAVLLALLYQYQLITLHRKALSSREEQELAVVGAAWS